MAVMSIPGKEGANLPKEGSELTVQMKKGETGWLTTIKGLAGF